MRMVVQSRKLAITENLYRSLERRVHFALSRFNQRIRAVFVTLEDVNGPRGGVDKRCQVVVQLGSPRESFHRRYGRGFESAIAHATERAGRAVSRQLDRWNCTRTSGPGMARGTTDECKSPVLYRYLRRSRHVFVAQSFGSGS